MSDAQDAEPRLPGEPPAVDPAERAAIVEERIALVRDRVDEAGASGALLELRRDVAWLTLGGELHVVQGGDAVAAPVLVTPDAAVVVAPNDEAERIRAEELDGLALEAEVVDWWDVDALASVVARRVPRGSLLTGAALEAVLAPVRPRLTAPEHARMRWLARVARAALDGATTEMRAGRTEPHVVAALVAPLAAAGVRAPVVLAGADERMRFRHPLPRDAALRDRLMLVLVAERWGLHVAGTRMAWLSGEGEAHAADVRAARVLDAMAEASRPGATLGQVLDVARRAYEREGLDGEWRQHHQGGTIGYAPRERIATPGDPFVIEEGMAVAWNPSVPGGKAEATLLVGRDGAEAILR